MKLEKFSAKLVANFRRSLEGDFRASFAWENRQKHFPPKLHRKFHHQTSLRGSGLWRALQTVNCEAGKEGAVEAGVKRGLIKAAHREIEASIARKP